MSIGERGDREGERVDLRAHDRDVIVARAEMHERMPVASASAASAG